jgi:hypothetical protein
MPNVLRIASSRDTWEVHSIHFCQIVVNETKMQNAFFLIKTDPKNRKNRLGRAVHATTRRMTSVLELALALLLVRD